MNIRRIFYTLIILFFTFISVSLIIYDKKELSKGHNIYFKGLHTINLPEELKEDNQKKTNEEKNDDIEKISQTKKKQSESKLENEKEVFSNNIMIKEDELLSHIEFNADYDEETQKFLISQLKEGIKRAKLDQFEDRLSGDTIKDLNIENVKNSLSKEDKQELNKIIDKLGTINGLKLIKIIDNGITPDEQKDIYNLFNDKLSDEEIISLNDILGIFAD